MNFELILENCKNGFIRLVVIERKGEEGVRMVRDIYEGSITHDSTARFFGGVTDLLETEGSITLKNEDIDFGRAKRWTAKMSKIISTLVKEDRYN